MLSRRHVAACAGMATHLSPDDQGLMLELFQAFSRLDGRGIGECTLKFSKDNQVSLIFPTPVWDSLGGMP